MIQQTVTLNMKHDDSQYLADDVKIVTKTNSNDAEEFVDNTLTSYSIETLDAALMKIRASLLQLWDTKRLDKHYQI